MKKILITGANGQLGTELQNLLTKKNIPYVAADIKVLDITNANSVTTFIEEMKPDVIYHCAAYTAVDKAEDEGKEKNQLVNVVGTKNVAQAAEKVGATVVYISTDYVFDGTKKEEYNVDDKPNPKNEYGRAKYEGELEIQKNCSKYYIIRTSWVYGQFGANFVFTMQKLAQTHSKLTIVNDQYGRPTWTKDLADFMLFLVNEEAEYGIYHFSNDDSCTWYEFAQEILKDEDISLTGVTSSEYPQKAKRPKYSILNLTKTKSLGYEVPTWQDSLQSLLKELEK